MIAADLETIVQAADRKAVSVSTIRGLIRKRRLRAVRIRHTRIVRLRVADVDGLFEDDPAAPAAVMPLHVVSEQ